MIKGDFVTSEEVNLTNCDREAINICGYIQPHGALFALQEDTLKILQVSNNTKEIVGIPPEHLIDRDLSSLLDTSQIQNLRQCLTKEDLRTVNPVKLFVRSAYPTLVLDGILHRHKGVLILEVEPSSSENNLPFFNFYHTVSTSVAKLQNASDLDDLCQNAVREIRKITGMDRIVVYQFDPDLHGMVIAEDKIDELESWVGLHYPKSDIPKPARDIFALNWIRLIPDINAERVAIVPDINPLTQEPLDISKAILRGVSPIHVDYINHMNVKGTLTITLKKENKLWGLIACHHRETKHLSYEVRTACEFLGQVMSGELSFKENHEDYDYRLQLMSIQAKLTEYMSVEDNFIDGLTRYKPNLLDIASADGAAIHFRGDCTLIGNTPNREDVLKLIDWLDEQQRNEVFNTDSLSQHYPDAERYKNVASGLLGISISKETNNYVLWFRPEEVQTVNWAGNPNKGKEIDENGNLVISPRTSFELWKETVRFKSFYWKECEIEAVEKLRNAIIKIVLRQADELAHLNQALQQSEEREREKADRLEKLLEELKQTQSQLVQSEKMSSLGQLVAGVAHEINNPVNFIYGNLIHADTYIKDLLNLISLYREMVPNPGEDIEEEIEAIELDFLQDDLPKLLKSMQVGADRIRNIIESLRNFSRVDESEMKPVNVHEGIDSTLLILSNRVKLKPDRPGVEIVKEYGELPSVECYASQLNQVFMNLLANALDTLEEAEKCKSSEEWTPQIRIKTETTDRDRVRVSIADNGMGIPEETGDRIFDHFFTTKPVGKGTGIGLSISHQIIAHKHGGQMHHVSQPNEGTEFIVEIPLRQPSRSKK